VCIREGGDDMRRRWVRWLLIGAAVLASGPLLFFLGIPDDARVSRGDYDCVLGGMSQPQVESIFGCPAVRDRDLRSEGGAANSYRPGARMLIWDGHEGHAGVTFDAAGKVSDKFYTPATDWTRRNPITRRVDRVRGWWKSLETAPE
jgi:hypothetical protein